MASPTPIDEYKIQATILLKNLRSGNQKQQHDASTRLQAIPQLKNLTLLELEQKTKLKHALNVIAIENQHPTWAALKNTLEHINLYPHRCHGFINIWYPNHETAKHHLQTNGGYLLPYKTQYFICEAPYITALGLEFDDPDWQVIGFDWAQPADYAAWFRLVKKLQAVSD